MEDYQAPVGNAAGRARPCIGPVLIVCFTNHALDQFLEGLVAAGLTSLVRVGGRYHAQHHFDMPPCAATWCIWQHETEQASFLTQTFMEDLPCMVLSIYDRYQRC